MQLTLGFTMSGHSSCSLPILVIHWNWLSTTSPTVLSLWSPFDLELFVILSICFQLGFILDRAPVVSAGASFGHAFVAVVAREGTKGHEPSSRCDRGSAISKY